MVAPSFADFERVSEVYIKNGKYYIDVKNPRTSNVRSVRWYSDAEYAKNYGPKLTTEEDHGFDMLKHARGFDYGPILVIRNNRPQDDPWLWHSVARYAVGIGWYIASEDKFPDDAPPHLKYLLLSFDEFKIDDRHAKKPLELKAILDKKARKGEWFNING